MRYILTLTLALTATTALAQAPTAPVDHRWAPWLGCWQLADESIDDGERLLGGLTAAPARAPGARVCVTPSTDGGATLTTLVGGKAVMTETILADGQPRPVVETGCQGSQRAEFSVLGPRIYARTEVACGNQPTRTVSGLSTVVGGPRWLDIQMIESQGRKSMRVRHFRRADDQTGAPTITPALAAIPPGGTLSLADIKEASVKAAPETLHAIVLELGARGYDLNAARLIDLDEAGVPDSVIDLMVALSFPKKFVVERAMPTGGPSGVGGGWDDVWGAVSPLAMWGYYADPMYYWSYYSPFGYYNWGYYDRYYYRSPGVVVINPGGDNTPDGTGTGRVVDGFGYTRIRPNIPDPPARAGGAASGSSGANTGSSDGGSVSTGGYSGGGGGGRTAVPRPPGRD